MIGVQISFSFVLRRLVAYNAVHSRNLFGISTIPNVFQVFTFNNTNSILQNFLTLDTLTVLILYNRVANSIGRVLGF